MIYLTNKIQKIKIKVKNKNKNNKLKILINKYAIKKILVMQFNFTIKMMKNF